MGSYWTHVSVWLLLCLLDYAIGARWAHTVTLNPDYRLLWTLGPSSQDITFEIQVRTLGYVGFGLSRDGRMAGADMVVGWVDQGQVYFQDRHVKETHGNSVYTEPEVDPSQDYQLLLGYENDTHTVLRFTRRLDTCDHHDVPISDDTMRILWLYHEKEPAGGSVNPGSLSFNRVESKGTQSLYLVQRADQDVQRPEETTSTWELRNPYFEHSEAGDTLYWCKIFQLPSLTRKHHLIGYEPIQGTGASGGLQRISLYECQETPDLEQLTGLPGKECYKMGSEPIACNTAVASWARGSQGFIFPPEAGYPIEPSTSRYYLLETQYDSTGGLEGSGIRLYYTPELRRYDAGVISIGIDPNWRHIIPPKQQKVVSSGHCISECTKRAFPHSGIDMFAVVMRTHSIGQQIVLRHLRNGIEQPPIASDHNIDADYQEYRKLTSSVKILPGDHLIAECTYNSSGRSVITLGGLTSREETCIVMGLYYPTQRALAVCHSLPSLPTVLRSLGIQELTPGSNPVRISAPPELAGMTLEARLVSYDWENQFQGFQEATKNGSFKPVCWTSQSTLLPGTDMLEAHYPNITKSYTRLSNQCGTKRHYTPADNRLKNSVSTGTDVSATSNRPTVEESLRLSRINSSGTQQLGSLALIALTALFMLTKFAC